MHFKGRGDKNKQSQDKNKEGLDTRNERTEVGL